MRKTCLAAAATVMLAACGSEQTGTFETEDGDEGTYSIDATGGNSEIRMQGEDGEEITINSGSDVAVDLPDGYSIYPGASVVSNTVANFGGGTGAMIIMTTQDSPEEVADYYRQQAEGAGIEVEMEVSGQGSKMIAGEGPDGRTFSFNASTDDDGTTAQLMVGENMGD